MNAGIKQITEGWKVQISFNTGEQAAEFKRLLEKARERSGSALYNALMLSALKHGGNIEIVKVKE